MKGWLASIAGWIIGKLFGKSDTKQAYDQGVTQGTTAQQNIDNHAMVEAATDANATRDNVGRLPARAARDELRKWSPGSPHG